jgi:hypothetical protein
MLNMPFPHGETILFQFKVISYNTVFNLDRIKDRLKHAVLLAYWQCKTTSTFQISDNSADSLRLYLPNKGV